MSTPFREATIDTAAIADNVRTLRRVSGTEVFAIVKADGYGHGATTAARAALAGGAARVGVADLTEATALRAAGITAPIMAWLHAPGEDFARAVTGAVEVGVSSLDQLAAAGAAGAAGTPLDVHLKIDTGLSRNGAAPDTWLRLFAEAARLERAGHLRVVGLFSHLANTSEDADARALAAFEEGARAATEAGIRPRFRHLAATEAALDRPALRLDAVRCGIGIYGVSPFAGRTAADLGLRPAMTLRAAVAAVRRVPAGAGASYGHDFIAPRETTLALVPLGYSDGIPRQASGRGHVVIAGQRMPVAGRVAMDQFIVDAGDTPVRVGDEVTVFGDPTTGAPEVTEWADAAGTIGYDIVTGIGARVPRRAV